MRPTDRKEKLSGGVCEQLWSNFFTTFEQLSEKCREKCHRGTAFVSIWEVSFGWALHVRTFCYLDVFSLVLKFPCSRLACQFLSKETLQRELLIFYINSSKLTQNVTWELVKGSLHLCVNLLLTLEAWKICTDMR